jgi:hypothetical protein
MTVFGQENDTLIEKYRDYIPLDQDVVSGGYFVDPPKTYEGHPYFLSKNFEVSQITINGLTYPEVPLLYNIWKDEVLTFQPVHKQKILIRSDKIDRFVLQREKPVSFVRLHENPNYSHHGNGIYELYVGGPASILIKHRKQTNSKREVGVYTHEFYELQDYFIKRAEKIMQVTAKKQATVFLGLDKKEMRKLTREAKLDYRSDKASYLEFLVSVYNDKQHEKK